MNANKLTANYAKTKFIHFSKISHLISPLNLCCGGLQGRNEGRKGGTIPRVPKNYALRGRQKNQQCRKNFLQHHIYFQTTIDSNMGAPNLFFAPGAI